MRFPFLLGAAMALTLLATPAFAASQTATPTADVLVTPAPKAGRSHALIVIVADSAGAQTTDFIIPYSILKDAGFAEVHSLSIRAGNLRIAQGLTVVANETIAAFDAREPAGAGIVIVPVQARQRGSDQMATRPGSEGRDDCLNLRRRTSACTGRSSRRQAGSHPLGEP